MRHEILGGEVQLYKRQGSSFWWCSASIAGKQRRNSTKQESLSLAKDIAEDWYLTLHGKSRAGQLVTEKTFAQAAGHFLQEYAVLTEGQRSPRWVQGYEIRLRLHVLPFFGDLGVSQITPGKAQEYRIHRQTSRIHPKTKHPLKPSASTIHDEIITIRQVLKTAIRHGWLDRLPDLSPAFRGKSKIEFRPWFSPSEYKQLYHAAREYAQRPFHGHQQWNAQQVYDYILFIANTGLRPDEAKNLQHRDVEVVYDEATRQNILELEIRGKRGRGHCKSMPGAVITYERLLARPLPSLSQTKRARRRRGETGEPPTGQPPRFPQPTDPVFPGDHKKLFNGILERAGLKFDRDGKRRTAYSLRHTYICIRLMEGADIYQIAKNCRTSVEMIQKFYAAHIKNTLDASAINTRRPKPKAKYAPRIIPANGQFDEESQPFLFPLPAKGREPA